MATASFQLLRPYVWKQYLTHLIFSYSAPSQTEPVGPIFKIDQVGDHILPSSLLQPWCKPVHISRDWHLTFWMISLLPPLLLLFSTQQSVLACQVFAASCLRVQDKVLTYDIPPHHPHLLRSLSSLHTKHSSLPPVPGSHAVWPFSAAPSPFVSLVKYLLSHPLSLAIPAKSLFPPLLHFSPYYSMLSNILYNFADLFCLLPVYLH